MFTRSIILLAFIALSLISFGTDAQAQFETWKRHNNAGFAAYHQGAYEESEKLYNTALKQPAPWVQTMNDLR